MNHNIIESVRDKYGSVADSGLSSRDRGVKAVAEAFGYTDQELTSIPAEANMGLSCGNPTAFASLKEGEIVVDLGCGGGLDVFLAAQRVGPHGKAIGIDMTPRMIDLARKNAAISGVSNVEFYLSTIDRIPIPDDSADCIISNCVINLAPDKSAVFREAARVLKPGGRLAISDIALKKPLPADLADNLYAYVGCISGAILIDEYKQYLFAAGFSDAQVIDSGVDLNAYNKAAGQGGCCSPAMVEVTIGKSSAGHSASTIENRCDNHTTGKVLHGPLADILSRYNINEYAASVKVYALKP